MKNIIFLIFALFIFNSCSDELITIVDEYNPPYEIKAIPGDGSISINFWSGVLASDFVGFNLYIQQGSSSFTQAVLNPNDGSYPTYRVDEHTRSNFTLQFPTSANIQNDTLYYVTVTAYGTNDLVAEKYIETKISEVIPVVPRAESQNNGGFNIAGTSTVSLTGGGQIRTYGYQSNFNSITVFTNNNTSTTAQYGTGWLYIGISGNNLYKLRINSDNNYTSATHSQGGTCNTI